MMIGELLQGIRNVDKARVAKSGGIAVAVTAGLTAASLAGVAIPTWAVWVGPAVGTVVYKLLPPKDQQLVDKVVDEVIDVATTIPQTYSAPTDFPNPPPTPTPNNLNKG